MSRRSRLAELLAQARAAEAEAGLEKSKGQREAASIGAWGNVASTAINAAATAAPGAIKAIDDDNIARLSSDVIAKNKGKLGELVPDDEVRTPVRLRPLQGVEGPRREGERDIEGPEENPDQPKPKPKDPFAPTAYRRTAAEEARAATDADPALADDKGFFGILQNGVKAKARRDAEAKLTADIEARRGAADKTKVDAFKFATERGDKDTEVKLKVAGMEQAERHFYDGLDATEKRAYDAMSHAEKMQARQQTFTANEGQKTRDFTRDVVIPAQGDRAKTMAGAQQSAKEENRVISESAVFKLKEKEGVVDDFKSIGVQAEALPDGSFGKLAGIEAAVRKATNTDDVGRRLMADSLADLAAKKLKIQTGTGVTAVEKKEFSDRFLSDMASPEVFEAKLRLLLEGAVQDHNRDLSGLRDAGYNTKGLRPVAAKSQGKPVSSEQLDDAAQFQ